MIIADTNLIVALACKTENTGHAFAVQKKDAEWIAPPIWESEFRNVLLAMLRAKIIGINTANAAFQFAAATVETFPVSTGAVLRLAEAHGLTAYDAEFAALSEWIGVSCLSFDTDLLNAGLATHPKDF